MSKLKNWRGCIVYIVMWLVFVLWFWTLLPADGGMAYYLLVFYLAFPVVSFVAANQLGRKRTWLKWVSPIFFGCMPMLLVSFTFHFANTLAAGRWHAPDVKLALFSSIPSFIGLASGLYMTFLEKIRADIEE